MRLVPSISVYDNPKLPPWLCEFKWPFSWELLPFIQEIPGNVYGPKTEHRLAKGVWRCARSAIPSLRELAADVGLGFLDKTAKRPHVELPKQVVLNPELMPYQAQGVGHCLFHPAFLLAYEMRLGKTFTSIEAARVSQAKRILVVCPGGVARGVWEDEIPKWWCGSKVHIAYSGDDANKLKGNKQGWYVTSYALAKHWIGQKYDVIICDESQALKNARSQRSIDLMTIRNTNINAKVILLSGTPIEDSPKDLYGQLELMEPGSYGHYLTFCKRYCNVKVNEHGGHEVWGVNEEKIDELRQRMPVQRVTKEAVKDLLPPFTATTIYIKSEKNWDVQELLDLPMDEGDAIDGRGQGKNKHEEKLSKWLTIDTGGKVKHALEWARDTLELVPHATVLTHFKRTAERIAKGLTGKGYHVALITGDTPPKERKAIIGKCKKAKKSVLVATMHSVGVAIDLSYCTNALFAELYWVPAVVLQAMARFYQPRSKNPVAIDFLICRGTIDEPILVALRDKMRDMTALIDAGHGEDQLSGALSFNDETESEFQNRIREIAANMAEDPEGYY